MSPSSGHKSLPYPLKKKDGKMVYQCETCDKVESHIVMIIVCLISYFY